MEQSTEVEDLQFKWGKKRGIGGKNKKTQFYESFTYDHKEYTLYDCVYAYGDKQPEPHVGKIIKIWETPDKGRHVKLLWFFKPFEVLSCLNGVDRILENEIFLASGEAIGVTNVNPLESIAGKCEVVCILKDDRNPQPTDEEIKKADFLFRRLYDVDKCKLLDKIDEKVAGIEVKYIFNQPASGFQKPNVVQKIGADMKTNVRTSVAIGQTGISSKANASGVYENEKRDGAFVSLENGCVEKTGEGSEGSKRIAPEKSLTVEVKSTKDFGSSDRPLKKQKLEGPSNQKNNKSLLSLSSEEGKRTKAVLPCTPKDNVSVEKNLTKKPSFDEKYKRHDKLNNEGKETRAVASIGSPREGAAVDKPFSKNRIFNDKPTKETEGKVIKPSSKDLMKVNYKTNYQAVEVTRKPDSERSKWFKKLPWEDRVQTAYKDGTLVLLENLDPTSTSAEVEDIVFHGLNEMSDAKMIQRTPVSIPHIGQALVIFKTKEAAEKAVERLNQGCLLVPNGRPLVGRIAKLCPQGKQSTFNGHLVIDKLRLQTMRDMKDAVSTSHCSQPNTLEYDMAMEWCLHQARFKGIWEKLFKQQGDEMKKVQAGLKRGLP